MSSSHQSPKIIQLKGTLTTPTFPPMGLYWGSDENYLDDTIAAPCDTNLCIIELLILKTSKLFIYHEIIISYNLLRLLYSMVNIVN